jgi:MoaA/NifB/PqqE/SkfB family radical SAM enzyme
MAEKRNGSSFTKMNGAKKLDSLFLFTTGRCNAKCAMCFYAGEMEKKNPDMTFDQIKKISETAGQFTKLWLSGGEPTLREELPEILAMFYKNNGVRDFNCPSNAILGDRVLDIMRKTRENCPDANFTLSVSLDGFAATHDKQRGAPSFYKAIETLKRVEKEFGNDGHIITNIGTVITKYNVEEVLDFMQWVYGRLGVSNHIIEAARGTTREDGVKILTGDGLREIQDKVAPYYFGYAERIAAGVGGGFIAKAITKFMYLGLLRAMYDIRATNVDHPTSWEMECSAGETTLVLDYDGRFRSCELRQPIGNIAEYDCDVQKIMQGEAMKKEVEAIGGGYKANCWCTHGCWLMTSLLFNPKKMRKMLFQARRELKALKKPIDDSEASLAALEDKYNLDKDKLREIGVLAA